MPQENQQEVPQVVIQGLNAVNKVEKVVSKNIEFNYNDLDQADELRQGFQVIRNELAQLNQVARQQKIQQNKGRQVPQTFDKSDKEPTPAKMEAVGKDESEGSEENE